MTLQTRTQLIVFAVVGTLVSWYGAVELFHADRLVRPPYEVSANFATAGGIAPRADVDLIGMRVGTVKDVLPGPRGTTVVTMALNHDMRIPSDVTATVASKSAIGEQYIELKSPSGGAPYLAPGDRIPLDRTVSGVDVTALLEHVDALAASVPLDDLSTVLDESARAFTGTGISLGRLLDHSESLTRQSLENVDDLTALIRDARTVLDTQVDFGSRTTDSVDSLAKVVHQFELGKTDLAELMAYGARSGQLLSTVLAENQLAIAESTTNLTTLTIGAADRVPAIRKTLVVFPWMLEVLQGALRYCDEYNPKTGKPVESTCHYDDKGRPIWSVHLAIQLSEDPGKPPYFPCTKGYEDTVKYFPDGTSMNGGPRQGPDSPPNEKARCTAKPTDPNMPNVRGEQNIPGPTRAH